MIFLELHKAYGALDRETFLYILEGNGMGPRARCILCEYWYRIWMVARTGDTTGLLSKVSGR